MIECVLINISLRRENNRINTSSKYTDHGHEISMPLSLIPLEVFDFGMSGASISQSDLKFLFLMS